MWLKLAWPKRVNVNNWYQKQNKNLLKLKTEWKINKKLSVQIALENLLSHHCGSSIHKVTSVQLASSVALHEMTWNNNTVADVVNDPVNPNNGGESLSVSKSSSS